MDRRRGGLQGKTASRKTSSTASRCQLGSSCVVRMVEALVDGEDGKGYLRVRAACLECTTGPAKAPEDEQGAFGIANGMHAGW